MTDNVVSIHGKSLSDEGRANLVAELEDVLERVRSGDVIGVGLVLQHADNAGAFRLVGMVSSYSMLGACVVLQNHITKSVS